MTTTSGSDINAFTAIHVGKTTVGYIKGQSENSLLEDERERQLTDLQYREGATLPGIQYPIAPSQDEAGALAYEPKGIHPRSNTPNEANRGLGGLTKPGMGGSKPPDTNQSITNMDQTPMGVRSSPSKRK